MSALDSVEAGYERAREALAGLPPRDRALLMLMAGIFLLGLAWFANGAMVKARKKVKAQIAAVSMAQMQVDALLAEYNGLSGSAEALDAKLEAGRGFAPLSWLEKIGNDMQISSNIRSIQERGNDTTDYYVAQKYDITIDDVTLDQTVEFLHKMESAAQAIRITECRLKPDRKDRNKIDVRMEIAVLKPTGEA